MLKAFINAISIISVYAEIIDNLSSFFLKYIVIIFPSFSILHIKVIAGICFLLILIHSNMKQNIIVNLNYRIEDFAKDLDLQYKQIKDKKGLTVCFYMKKVSEAPIWIDLFDKLNLKLLVKIDCPKGLKLDIERINSDFKEIHPKKPNSLWLSSPLDLDGRRNFKLYIESEKDTSFEGHSELSANIYISSTNNTIRNLFTFSLSKIKIGIIP
jgi:hypothetical protein